MPVCIRVSLRYVCFVMHRWVLQIGSRLKCDVHGTNTGWTNNWSKQNVRRLVCQVKYATMDTFCRYLFMTVVLASLQKHGMCLGEYGEWHSRFTTRWIYGGKKVFFLLPGSRIDILSLLSEKDLIKGTTRYYIKRERLSGL